MPESVIEWEVSEQNLTQELTSKDRRWHISKKQTGRKEPEFFMSNYDLLLTPHGSGSDYFQCFQTFIADCGRFVELAGKIKAEAERHLVQLEQAAKAATREYRNNEEEINHE
jgi:hypothetical protein